MKLLYTCPKCKGLGGDGNPETAVACAYCNDVGEIETKIRIPDLDDLKKTVDDIMDKCNDIADAVEALE